MLRNYKHLAVTLNGREAPLSKWITDSGIRPSTIWQRLERGCSPLEALITPDREGRRLHIDVGLDQINLPCNPSVTIGAISKSLAEWCDLVGLPIESVARAVNGGVPPVDALTKWCGREDVFWTRFWEEQLRQYEEDHAANAFALDEAESCKALYLSVRQDGRYDPLDYYFIRRYTDDATKAAKHYANTADEWFTTDNPVTMKDADEGIIRFFEALGSVVTQLHESLVTVLGAAVPDFAIVHKYYFKLTLEMLISDYIYRALKANLGDVTTSPLERAMVEQDCEV